MNDYILWTIDHFNKKKREIVSTQFITYDDTTMLEILDFVTQTPVLCYPNDCDPLEHKIKQKSITTDEREELTMVEFKDLKTVEGIWDIE